MQSSFSNEELGRVTQMLTAVQWLLLTGLLLVLTLDLVEGRWLNAHILTLAGLFLGSTIALSRRGYVRLAAFLVLLALLVVLNSFLYLGDGISDLAVLLFPIEVAFAGLLLEKRPFIIIVALCVASAGTVIYAQNTGRIVPRETLNVTLYDFLVTSIILIIMAIAVRVVVNHLNDSLLHLRQEIQERKWAETALQASQIDLHAKTESLLTINAIHNALHRTLDPVEIGQSAVNLLTDFLHINQAAIYSLEEETETLH
ncbi:MAG: hypothetical protein H6664_12215, partial [Ardenticatenaceae bacterium]|nr:hypothetical protein [Ardenticatenaceae bacterium]